MRLRGCALRVFNAYQVMGKVRVSSAVKRELVANQEIVFTGSMSGAYRVCRLA